MARAVIFREPALVKAVTTLDVRSGGRAWPGIGAGYQHEEGAALGLPMPPTAERFERLGEALRIALAMRAGDQRPIQGMADRPHVAGHRLRWRGTDAGQVRCLRVRCGRGPAAVR